MLRPSGLFIPISMEGMQNLLYCTRKYYCGDDCEFVNLSPVYEILLQNFGGGQRLYLLRVFFTFSSCNQVIFL